jgi:hypothetical protein
VTLVADVDASSVRMYYFKTWIFGIYLPLQLPALLPVHISMLQSFKGGYLSLSHAIISYG